jgi:hypothetical protein
MREKLEALVGLLTPPACREEVLGDLHERNATSASFCLDALRTFPLVVFSRIRRTGDPQLLLLQAGVAYVCYWAAAWFDDRALLDAPKGLLRLAIPAAMVLLAVVFDDAYAQRGQRSPLGLVRGPLVGVALTFLSQAALWAMRSPLTLSLTIVCYGGALGLLLTSALRWLFAPQSASPKGPQAS